MLRLLTLACLVLTATAYCPNACSGRGKCQPSPKDSCECYTRRESHMGTTSMVAAFTGADCSLRK